MDKDTQEILKNLGKKFDEIYDYLYETDRIPTIYQLEEDMRNEFDNNLENDADFLNGVRLFNKYREDIISSDREAAAYMLASYYVF